MSSEVLKFEIQFKINSVRNKLELPTINVKDDIDILLIIIIKKIPQSFPDSQFVIDGYLQLFR